MFGFMLGLLSLVAPAHAGHIPLALDVPLLWSAPTGAGYLNFVEPGPVPVGTSGTEEYTGWVDTPFAPGASGATADLGPGFPAPAVDNGITHGDRIDFDFVVENRTEELAPVSAVPVLHPGITGFLTWEIAPTAPSGHINPATGLPHSHAPGPCPDLATFVCLLDFAGPTFDQVDVFSIIADPVDAFALPTDPFGIVADGEIAPRDAALDYMLDFCNIVTGACVPGTPVMVFVPGWSAADTADDYVARWVLSTPLVGGATHVMIDPIFADPIHPDEIIQIDALVVSNMIPVPAAVWLFGSALGLLGWLKRKH
jgi:hypothetical protein